MSILDFRGNSECVFDIRGKNALFFLQNKCQTKNDREV